MITRPDIERMFVISKRPALELLRSAGARRIGVVLAVPADELSRALGTMMDSVEFRTARARRERFVDALRVSRAARVRFRDTRVTTMEGLPEGVAVRPGEIAVQFESVEEALSRLFALAQAISRDYDRFAALAAPRVSSADAEERR